MSDSAEYEEHPRQGSKESDLTRTFAVPPLPDGAVERAASQKRAEMTRSDVSHLVSTDRQRGFSQTAAVMHKRKRGTKKRGLKKDHENVLSHATVIRNHQQVDHILVGETRVVE